MKKNEAYNTLGIQAGASEQEIKKAFRKKAIESHPDKNPNNKNAEVEFKKINQAHQILTGAEKAEDEKVFVQEGNFNNDFFRRNWQDIFGGGSPFDPFTSTYSSRSTYSTARPPKRKDVSLFINLSFIESILGCDREIEYKKEIFCKSCQGLGKAQSSLKTCPHCKGLGYIDSHISNGFMAQMMRAACAACSGSGKTGENCKDCNGLGFNSSSKKIKVKIPPIGDQKSSLIIRNAGHEYKGFNSNVLIDVIPTIQHENMYIKNNNVISKEDIPLDLLLFGGEKEVDVVDGKQTIIIPEKSKVGSVVIIKDKGVQVGKFKQAGHHLVELGIKYPTALTEELKTALENAYKEE